MDDTEFNRLADLTMQQIETVLEDNDIDFETLAGGVLEIEFADGSKIIVNRHAVAREIWVAARSGGFHFRWNGNAWVDTRDASLLLDKLALAASLQAGRSLDFG